MIYRTLIPFIIFLAITFQSSALMSEHNKYRGKVLKVNGDVEIVNVKGEKRLIKKADEPVKEMDTIVMKKGVSSVVQFNDGVLLVPDEKSDYVLRKPAGFLI